MDHLFAQVDEQKRSTPNDPGCLSRDPAFHETTIITVPFGPSVLEEKKLPIKIGPFPVFVVFVLCYVSYSIFITLVHNTTVNA